MSKVAMSHFELLRNPDPTSDLAALYDEIVDAGFGDEYPINWFTSLGTRPDMVGVAWGLVRVLLGGGELPGTLKQMILLAVSAQNDCRYCAVTHAGVLQTMGVPADVITSCASDPTLPGVSSPHRELVQFAVKAARSPLDVGDDDLQALRELGIRDSEIMEVTMLAAFTNFINTWADAAGLELDSAPG